MYMLVLVHVYSIDNYGWANDKKLEIQNPKSKIWPFGILSSK